MTELERALVTLGNELEFPPTPDVWPRVVERLARRRWLRPAVFAATAAVLAVAIAFVVPPARSAILRFFHIGAATVERVNTLPPAQQRPLVSGLGEPVSHATLDVPRAAKALRYYQQPHLAAALLSYRGKPVLLAKIDGDQMGLSKKFVGGATKVTPVALGDFAIWLSGAPHVLIWQASPFGPLHEAKTRLAGNVLLWLKGNTTYRLEGDLNQQQMLDLARDITR
jgi:hypothetical protein